MSDGTTFNPTPRWQALLKAFQDADYDISVSRACAVADPEHAETLRRDYYEEARNPAFRAWWMGELEHFMTLQIPEVIGNLVGGAKKQFAGGKEPDKKPDAGLIKLFFERCDRDYMPKTRSEVEHSGAVDLGVSVHVHLMQPPPASEPPTPPEPVPGVQT